MIENVGARYPHLKQLFKEALEHVEGNEEQRGSVAAVSSTHGQNTDEEGDEGMSSSSESTVNRNEEHSSTRAKGGLDVEDAKVIFCAMPSGKRKVTRTSKLLGAKYGVSPKTIRDIWNKRTWVHATVSFWTKEEQMSHSKVLCDNCSMSVGTACLMNGQCACRKKLGRPSGARDRKPRKRRGLGFSGISSS